MQKGFLLNILEEKKSEEVTKKSACDGSCRKYDDDKYFSDEYLEYVRTVRNNSYYGSDGSLNVITNSFHARAFVVAEDGTIIYGNNVESMSIPEVAYYFYKNAMSSNYNGHAYLYDTILSRISGNKYYLSTKVDYGWNDNLYAPGK